MDLDPWSAITKTATSIVGSSADTKMAQFEAAKKALHLLQSSGAADHLVELCLSVIDEDNTKLLSLLNAPDAVKLLNEKDSSGLFPLTYATVMGNETATTLMLNKSTEMINTPDGLFGYTPLMWAVYYNRKDIAVELLNYGADPNVQGWNGVTVHELLKPDSDMYDFFEEHGLLKDEAMASSSPTNYDFYKSTNDGAFGAQDDELMDSIRLKTAGLNVRPDLDDGLYKDNNAFITSNSLLGDEFDFNRLLKNQYIIFSDYDILAILDLIFTLDTKFTHKTTYPAAVIYQCVRYADHLKDNDTLVENFMNLAFTKIRSNTSSKSGVTSVYSEGDIVLQSYWLSVLNFLFFYLCRDDGFFKRYPKILQELITTLQSLMIELANSIKFRLNGMVDDCLLNYTSIPDIGTTLYKNDWNFFKKKSHAKSTYEEILEMLYPPSVKEQLKPSPIRIIQTFGALLYVLDLHNTHPLITQQTLSIVFYWLGCTLFNRIVSQKKYMSRAKAIQLRLNISVVEDWARSNDREPKIPDMDQDLLKLFPYTLMEDDLKEDHTLKLHGVALFHGDPKNTFDSAFYHTDLYNIVTVHMEPTFELLQWLQCLSGLQTSEEVDGMISAFQKLNVAQLWTVMDKYRYELDEAKVDKQVRKIMEKKAKKENSPVEGISYVSKDSLLLLNQDLQFPVVIPTVLEMVDQYGAGIGGVNKERAIKFQPFLPVEILDSVDEIHEQRTKLREQQAEEETLQNELDDSDGEDGDEAGKVHTGQDKNDNDDEHSHIKGSVKDDDLFGELRVPSSLAHREWGNENEINPW